MAWWMRPPPESLLGQDEPLAGLADQVVGGHAAVVEHDLRVVARAPVLGVGVRHGVDVPHDLHARGTRRNDEHRGVPVGTSLGVGLGEHQHDVGHRGVGDEPLVAVDHPFLAVLGGGGADHRRVGAGEERLGQRKGAGDVAPEVGPEPPFLLRLGGTVRHQLHVPAVGRLHPENGHRHHATTDDLRHQRQVQLPEPFPTEIRVEEGAPEAAFFDLVLEMALDDLPLLGGQLVEEGLEGDDLAVDERPHPGQILFELRLGLEVPRHPRPPGFVSDDIVTGEPGRDRRAPVR